MKTAQHKVHIAVIALALILLLATGLPVAAQEASPPPMGDWSTPVVARVYVASQDEINILARQLDIWEVHHEDGYLVALLTPEQATALEQAGYRLEVDVEKSALLHQPSQLIPNQPEDTITGYPCYRTVETTFADLQQLTTDHPTLAEWTDIGNSWDKDTSSGPAGYDLFALRLTNLSIPGPKPIFFLMAEIHAREYTTAELAARFAEYLVSHYGTDPDVTWLLDYAEVRIVPMTNPDGRKFAEQGYYWRKNTDNDDGCTYLPNPYTYANHYGTDLNRNSSFHWEDASNVTCNEVYQGPSPASEPETTAFQNYVQSIFLDQRGSADSDPAPNDATGVFITLHSYGNQVLFPWGWSPNEAPNNTALETLGRKLGYFNGYEVCQSGEEGCIYATTGTSDDWAYGELGIAAYTFEMGGTFFESCSVFESSVLPDNLPSLLYAFKAARRPYQNPSGPETLIPTPVLTTTLGSTIPLTVTADDTRYSINQNWGLEPVQVISVTRYSIDAPSWITGTVVYPMSASDGIFDETVEMAEAAIDTSGWTLERHTIFIESQDAAGNWGVPSAMFIVISPYGWAASATPIAAWSNPSTPVTYTLYLTNTGILSDTYNIAITSTWAVTMTHPVGSLPPGGSTTSTITVSIPVTALPGAIDTATITITSLGEPGLKKQILFTTHIYHRLIFPLMMR